MTGIRLIIFNPRLVEDGGDTLLIWIGGVFPHAFTIPPRKTGMKVTSQSLNTGEVWGVHQQSADIFRTNSNGDAGSKVYKRNEEYPAMAAEKQTYYFQVAKENETAIARLTMIPCSVQCLY